MVRSAPSLWRSSRSSSLSQPQTRHSLIFSKPISNPSWVSSKGSLYKRISPVGDPNVSIVPILDRWVKQGNNVKGQELRSIIRELCYFKRFKHALEISEWMCNKQCIAPSQSDVAARLNLIYKVYGPKMAEEYFTNIPNVLKGFPVYSALLECYAREKCVKKAEALMEEIRDMGVPRMPYVYNHMMNLYYQTRKYEKLEDMVHEMEVRAISYDRYTYAIRLSAYAAAADVKGIDKIVAMVDSNILADMDCGFFAVAADGYLKVGQVDKAVKMLQKLEGLLKRKGNRKQAFDLLIKLYAKIGMKNELCRVWNLYKSREKIYNRGYGHMMGSLLKLDDIEGARKIFEDWESTKLSGDIRIPNLLVSAYSRKGLLEEAEAIIKKAVARGIKPLGSTWYYMAKGYLKGGKIEQAMEAVKKAILVCAPDGKLKKETLAAFLEYLEVKGNNKGPDELLELMDEDIFSADAHE
ncbi:Pentatricopeptide repeat, partial [Dillenia turbinata]